MSPFQLIRKLAKTNESQNLFQSAQDLNGIRLFKNEIDFSTIQQIYLSYLYFYNTINSDLGIYKISKKVLNNEIYEDAYMLWRKEKGFNYENKDNEKHDLKLVMSNKIKFPKSEEDK